MPFDTHHHACRRAQSTGLDGFTLPGATKHYPPDLEIEPVHTDIALHVRLPERTAEGTVTHTLLGRGAAPRHLTLHGVGLDDLTAKDPDGGHLHWAYDGRELRITWPEPFKPGEKRRVAIDYAVVKPASGLFFSQPSEAYPDEAWYAATDHETERARHWLPCVDLPSARPRIDFHLRAESRFTILANGALVSEGDNGDGTKTAHWRLDFPCPSYLTCFAIGDFVRADDEAFGDIPIAYFATRDHPASDLQRAFGRTPEMLAWLTKLLDRRFPFPKYFQFALPGFGGAMENISLVSWNDLYVVDEVLATEWGHLVDAVNIHEMAHSYFGDAIVVRDFAHAWLKESWATYIEQCWWEYKEGDDAALYDYYVNAHAYFKEADDSYKRPIVTRKFNSSWQLYDRHLYPGGACRLHTLRRLLGDDVFWPGVRDYVAQFEGRVVETEDFRRIMEARSGRSLVAFFDQWFYAPGYPALKVSFKYDKAKAEGTFEVEQTQEDEKAGVPLFEFDLDLGWVSGGRLQIEEVSVREKKHTFIIAMESEPEQVRVDPGAKVLHKLEFDPGAPMLQRQLTDSGDILGRLHAATTLVKSGSAKNVRAVRDAYSGEPFWGVRVEMARALGEANTQEAVEALAELVASENDPKVLPAVIAAAGEYRDVLVKDAVVKRLETGPLGYLAKRTALEALGRQRSQSPFAILADAAGRDGFGGIVQSAAFRALASSRNEAAADLLMKASRYGATSNRARPAAVVSMGGLGRVLEAGAKEELREALVDRLRDPVDRVRQAAVAGLRALGDPSAIGDLEAYKASLPAQEQVSVDRAIAAIRAAAKPRAKASAKELEDLQDELRKLKESVTRLEARAEADEGGDAGVQMGVAAEAIPEVEPTPWVKEEGPKRGHRGQQKSRGKRPYGARPGGGSSGQKRTSGGAGGRGGASGGSGADSGTRGGDSGRPGGKSKGPGRRPKRS